MNLSTLLSSTTNLLLFGGLVVLFLNVIFSALRLARGHAHTGIIRIVNTVLALGAGILIVIGLVRLTFPALASTTASTGAAVVTPTVSAAMSGASSVQAVSNQVPVQGGSQAGQPPSGQMPAGQPPSGQMPGGQPPSGGQMPNGQPPSGLAASSGQSTSNSAAAATTTSTAAATPVQTIPTSRLTAYTALGSVILLLAGLILYFGERRRQGFKRSASAGLLYASVGVFVLAAALVLPGFAGKSGIVSASSTTDLTAGRSALAVRAVVLTSTPTVTPVPSGTPTVLPTLTPVPGTSPTALFTEVAYAASTEISTTTTCSLTAQTTLNLRGDPSTQQMAIGKVFAGSILSVTGQSADKKWWRVISTDGGTAVEGWVSGDYVKTMSGCAGVTIPIFEATTAAK